VLVVLLLATLVEPMALILFLAQLPHLVAVVELVAYSPQRQAELVVLVVAVIMALLVQVLLDRVLVVELTQAQTLVVVVELAQLDSTAALVLAVVLEFQMT
jgi:hypothetical protein